jgi:sec-independent protein translocase protein TatA
MEKLMNDLMLAMLQTPEIIGLLVLALIFFGAKKLPELARGLGSGIKEFRKATRDVTDELQTAIESDPPPPRRPIPPPESQPKTPGMESSESAVSENSEAIETASGSPTDPAGKTG